MSTAGLLRVNVTHRKFRKLSVANVASGTYAATRSSRSRISPRSYASPATVDAALVANAATGRLSSLAGSPNALLQVGFIRDGGTTPDPEPDPEPEPEPEPDPAPCTSCASYVGDLGAGERDVQPDGNYYYSGSGVHRGYLRGSGGELVLTLYRWNGRGWARVAQSTSGGASHDIAYSGSAGYYAWTIAATSGSADYTLYLDVP